MTNTGTRTDGGPRSSGVEGEGVPEGEGNSESQFESEAETETETETESESESEAIREDEIAPETETADRVVVSYPADLSDWGRFQVEKPSFRAFLRKTREDASEGDVWEEFVGVGCCGNTLDVPLRVERVENGSRIDADTDVEYEVREACDLQGSWRVQSEGGPARG